MTLWESRELVLSEQGRTWASRRLLRGQSCGCHAQPGVGGDGKLPLYQARLRNSQLLAAGWLSGNRAQNPGPAGSSGGHTRAHEPAASHSRPGGGPHPAPAAGQRSPHSAPPSRPPAGPAVPPAPAAAGSAAGPVLPPAPAMPPPGGQAQAQVTHKAGPNSGQQGPPIPQTLRQVSRKLQGGVTDKLWQGHSRAVRARRSSSPSLGVRECFLEGRRATVSQEKRENKRTSGPEYSLRRKHDIQGNHNI